MARLGLYREFLDELIAMERPVQQKVVAALQKFEQATHAGAHLEKINNVRDRRLKSIRIDLGYRGIVLSPETGDQFLLLKVAKHDDAYAWAERHQASVNMATGQIEIRDAVIIDAAAAELAETEIPVPQRLFADVSDADLIRLGVDEQMRKFARLLTDIGPLDAISAKLPDTQCEVLYALAAGYSVEETWNMVIKTEEGTAYDPADVTAAAERTPSAVLLVDGPDELIQLFRKPFALWRVYLHPTQLQAAYGTFSGPAQVTGGPGTGKTVVALHRARHLARHGGRVLLTTFTGTLAASLQENLRLLEDDEETLGRIEVRTVDQIASRIVREKVGRYSILGDRDEQALWERIIRHRQLAYSAAFVAEEWRQVILAQDLNSLDAYSAARRVGRGKRLGPLRRAQIWQAIAEFEEEMTTRGTHTYDTVCRRAALEMAGEADKPYDHVIVDEAQDLHPVRWRLLRALVAPGTDDLFIAGDTHQRIYDNRVSLRSVGINVAGRSTRLTINYRTTSEILAWSHAMLSGESINDLDDGAATLTGMRSQVHGHTPEPVQAATEPEELEILVAKVQSWISSGVKPDEIGVAARSGPLAQNAARALSRAGVGSCHLTREKGPVPGQVQTMTMHRMKGLEFRCVAVIGVGEHQVPAPNSVRAAEDDELAHANDLQRERCLLFVACTRAREDLHVSWHGSPSAFLP